MAQELEQPDQVPRPGTISRVQQIKERKDFEIFWRVTSGETAYAVAKSLGVSISYVTRLIKGDTRADRKPRPGFEQHLKSDQGLKVRYDLFVREQSGDMESFATTRFAQEWRRTNGGTRNFARFVKICSGKILPEFRINPTIHEDPASRARYSKFDKDKVKEFVELFKAEKGLDDDALVDAGTRKCLRSWILDALRQSLTENEGVQLGISGEKENFGAYADQYLTDEEIGKAYEIMPEIAPAFGLYPEEAVSDFAFRLEWFGRPARITCIPTDMPQVTTNRINLAVCRKCGASSPGDGRYCAACGSALDMIAQDREVITTSSFLETKTKRYWTKAMIDPRGIAASKAHTARRKKGGKQFLFVDIVTPWEEVKHEALLSQLYRELYRRLGRLETYDVYNPDGSLNKASYWFRKPLYVMRHSGAHLWLRRRFKETGTWDFAFVAGMGWDDISTLAKCYGAMPAEVIMRGISKALAAISNVLTAVPGAR